MRLYIGTKIIEAEEMDGAEAIHKGLRVNTWGITGTAPGYFVRYPDGYESWSPKAVFEKAYRRISDDELVMVEKAGPYTIVKVNETPSDAIAPLAKRMAELEVQVGRIAESLKKLVEAIFPSKKG